MLPILVQRDAHRIITICKIFSLFGTVIKCTLRRHKMSEWEICLSSGKWEKVGEDFLWEEKYPFKSLECRNGSPRVCSSLSHVQLFAVPRTVAHQAPLSMGFSRQEHWSGCHSLLQEILATQGSNLGVLHGRQVLYHLSHQGSPGNYS